MKNLLKLFLIFILLGSSSIASAAVIYVDINATGSNNGLSWTNAYIDLQDALAAASSGDEIWVANGVYKPTATTDRNSSFEIPSGIALLGGFAGGETQKSQRDWENNPTVLSGAIGSQMDITDNTKVLIRVDNATEEVLFSGFKIQRAYNEGFGNFVFIGNNNVLFKQCEFRTNYANQVVFFVQFGKLEFEDCLFRDNESGTSIFTIANDGVLEDLNSTYAQNIGTSIFFTSTANTDLTLWNAIVSGNTLSGPVCETGVFSQAHSCVITEPNLGFTTTSNIGTDDPLFVDPASNNFRLQAASTAIGFGDNSFTSQGLDLGHEFRIQGANVDAGCYEANVPSTIYVDLDASGLNNGANWNNAFNDLQDALAVAEPGDEVWVADGTYYPTTTSDRTVSFLLPDDVKLYGGFNATETTLNQRNWFANLTILSGDVGLPVDFIDNSLHVVKAADANGNSHIDGFVIEEGNANGPDLFSEGGGISIQATTNCEIRNCLLRNNYAVQGGGIHVRLANGEIKIGQSILQLNEAVEGGGLYFEDDVEIESCYFGSNTTNVKGTVYGVEGSDLFLTNCTFFNNSVPDVSRIIDGTGTNDSWEIVNTIIWGNSLNTNLEPIRNVGPNTNVRLSILQHGHTGGTQIFNQDPLFMNPAAGDFGLQPTSVGFNAGDDSVVEEALDAARNDRIRLGQVDFGAVEASGAPASVIYVDIDALGANNGSSWEDAYTSLYDGLAAAADGDHVWVAEGLYVATSTYLVNDGINLHGGFNGTETLLNEADWAVNETIISGDVGVLDIITDNTKLLLKVEVDDTPVSISGFIIQDNYAGEIAVTGFPAVVINVDNSYNGLSSVEFKNCILRNNHSNDYATSSMLVSAVNTSGPLDVSVENCLFYNNSSANSTVSVGSFGVELDVVGCTFANNIQNSNVGATVTGAQQVINSIFWSNTAEGVSVNGSFGVTPEVYNTIYQAGSFAGANNFILDPLFNDAANSDFSLLAASPAINLGDNSFVTVDFDINHAPRIQFANVDAGALESPFAGLGCTDVTACNYNEFATTDDGSCIAPLWYLPIEINEGPIVYACEQPVGYYLADQACAQQIVDNDPSCVNVNWDGVCQTAYNCCIGNFGCKIPSACNYDVLACEDNSLCQYPGCTQFEACNYEPLAACSDPALCDYSCLPPVEGVIYVDIDATGANDGTSWTDAYTSLYDGLAAAVDGNQVWVAEGIYLATATYVISEGINLHGGFNGTEYFLSQSNWAMNQTIISGDLGVAGLNTDNKSHLLEVRTDETPVLISGFIIEDHYEETNELDSKSAVTVKPLNNYDGPSFLDVQNCVLRNNVSVDFNVSAIFFATSGSAGPFNVNIENCLFYENSAPASTILVGGFGYALNVIGCTFTKNVRTSTLGSIVGGPQLVSNNIFWDNSGVTSSAGASFGVVPTGSFNIMPTDFLTGTNTLTLDPLFNDAANNDFSLSSSSPAINFGDNSLVTVDFDINHNARIQSISVDVGAIESGFGIPAGCTDLAACNYDEAAEVDNGTCTFPGCLDETACNFDPIAGCNDNSLCEFDCIPAVPGVIYVNEVALGANDGSSWYNAFQTIYDALAVVQEGEDIWVAQGTYYATATDNEDDELGIGNDIRIFGGFNATETARNQRDWSVNLTVISGEIGDPSDLTDNTETIIRFTGGADISIIDGFIFEDFHSDLAAPLVSNSGVNGFRNCVFQNNTYPGYLFASIDGSTSFLGNCLFVNNMNPSGTGTLFSASNDTQMTIYNCTVADNEGVGFSVVSGGSASLEVENSIIWGHNFNYLVLGGGLFSVRNSITDAEGFSGVYENVIQEDPLFIGGGDYSLQSTSPAIGLGDNAQVFSNFDLAKETRIQNLAVDAGAYESPYTLAGCTDSDACNYNPNADTDDGSCGDGCASLCAGDFNTDAFVNASDLLVLLSAFSTNCGSPNCSGDMNGDSLVDTSDLLNFLGVFGSTCN